MNTSDNSNSEREILPPLLEHDYQRLRSAPLGAFFAPRSVAVIGASEKPADLGRMALWNLVSSPFGGKVFPIHPTSGSLLGIRACRRIGELPESIDLAMIATPAEEIVGVVRECVAAGVRGAVLLTGGFRKRGVEGARLRQEVVAIARGGGMRIMGPNCLGIMNPLTGLNASCARGMVRPGTVGFISQSGALAAAVLDWSLSEMVGFSSFVSVGSMADVDWGDLIDHFGDDPRTRSVVIYMETVGDARSFMSAAREASLGKPVIVVKAGRTDEAAKASSFHLGIPVGCDEVFDAAFRRCGVLRVNNVSDLFYMSEVLSRQPRTRGPRLAILTNAGGPGIIATDALIANGGVLAELQEDTLRELDAILPPVWSRSNPVDMQDDATPECYARTMEILSKDRESDGFLAILTPQASTDATRTAERLKEFARLEGRPVLASWMGGGSVAAGVAVLNGAGIPTFPYPDTAARAFAYMWRYSYNLRAIYETPQAPAGEESMGRSRAEAILHGARAEGRTELAPGEAAEVLEAYGIPFAGAECAVSAGPEFLVASRTDAQFGPVLLFGAGGRDSLAWRDRALALPPLNTTLARRMMEQTSFFRALSEAGSAAAPGSLEEFLVRFSRLVMEQRWIREMEINPLKLTAEGLSGQNARILLHPPGIGERDLPRPAIRPYPSQYTFEWQTKEGEETLIRPIRPEDEPLIVKFHETLSDLTVYYRYFHPMRLRQRVAHDRLIRICFVDYSREIALVCERKGPGNEGPQILGVGRIIRAPGAEEGEFAVVISDSCQRSGLGTELLRRLIWVAEQEGLDRISGDVLPDNAGMLRVCEKLGFRRQYAHEQGVVKAVYDIVRRE